ncbi:MAG: hypothetical protein ACKVP0_10735 [Pirellulaceae bacterium]
MQAIKDGPGVRDLPFSLPLELTISDPEIIGELYTRQEGREREEYALSAIRLGILALRQARGQLDATVLKREADSLLSNVRGVLVEHKSVMDSNLTNTLKEYFDPEDGRFNERVNRLLKKDGELAVLLEQHITGENSNMCRRLEVHLGKDSPLFRLLSPDESSGLLKAIGETVSKELATQRDLVLAEFSLDNEESALSRLISRISDNNGNLRKDLGEQISLMIAEFSFDSEDSAISRMSKTVASTNDAISKHLTLDDENSALSRLKRELLSVIETQRTQSQEFQNEVRETLVKMQAKREESLRSTRHGTDFEDDVASLIQHEAQRAGDITEKTGNTTGLIKNNKKGDIVVELSQEAICPGARIVVEAKEDASYDLKRALGEIETARQNRGADSGLFVFSSKTAPQGIELIGRFGSDVVVVWNAEDTASDVYLRLGLSVAKALCTRQARERDSGAIDFESIDRSLLAINKQIEELDKIKTWTETIRENSDKIVDRLRKSREKLLADVSNLEDKLEDLKRLFNEAVGAKSL